MAPLKRKPIILTPQMKIYFKIWEMTEITKEDDIYELSRHYDMLVIQTDKRGGYTSLPRNNPTKGKAWIHFERVYELCRMKGWDAKLYIEGQFERAKKALRLNFPLPNMMYSVNAIKYHAQYMTNLKRLHAKDVDAEKRKRGKQTQDLQGLILDGVISSVDIILEQLDRRPNQDRGQLKAITILNSWERLSSYYLYSVDWFHKVLDSLQGVRADQIRVDFGMIDNSPHMRRTIQTCVQKIEDKLSVPSNIKI